MNVSGLLRRFFAWLLDSFILAGLYFGLIMLLELLGVVEPIDAILEKSINISQGIVTTNTDLFNGYYYFWFLILFLIYEIGFVASSLSATPGKIILGIEVVSDSKSSIAKVILRALLKLPVVIIPLVSIIYFIIALANGKRQSLHDKVAKTYVVYKKTSNNYSNRINTVELFEEMKRRGLRTYSEQQALAEELYGKGGKKSKKSGSFGWVSVVLLIAAFVFTGVFYGKVFSKMQSMAQMKYIQDIRLRQQIK
ncbi:MAG TPA: RDD family protein [Acetivibrio sp.]|uniref:RDD family protein n=1 Tax=Acetivibrio sp. TaxID=1872092 RepID=UPI002C498508|nr:RDD family protein [Acetivibrio sp.]HOM02236.1 RDD family protein [Acetivibrio sp.]